MSIPTTKSQIDRLGERLRKAAAPSNDDLRALQALIRSHAPAVMYVVERIHETLPYVATPRLKTVDTLIEKLRRDHGRLSTVQDIAGCRLSPVHGLEEQDIVVAEHALMFDDPRMVDRRRHPSHGYRAVHVIVPVEGFFVEVQVRTVGQDQWAQITERLGDRWGRAIRYGGEPEGPDVVVATTDPAMNITRREVVELMEYLSVAITDLEMEQERLDEITHAERWLEHPYAGEMEDFTDEQYAYLSEVRDVELRVAERRSAITNYLRVLDSLADRA